MFITLIVKLISVNMNFLDIVQNGLLLFCQIKIRHIFKNVIGRHLVELNSHQTFGHTVFDESLKKNF